MFLTGKWTFMFILFFIIYHLSFIIIFIICVLLCCTFVCLLPERRIKIYIVQSQIISEIWKMVKTDF